MYQFNIVKCADDSWKFELNGINLIVDDFYVKDQKHWIKNPDKAIAFFNVKGLLYGVSNKPSENEKYCTAEDFYDEMKQQYSIFKKR